MNWDFLFYLTKTKMGIFVIMLWALIIIGFPYIVYQKEVNGKNIEAQCPHDANAFVIPWGSK